MLVSIVFDFIIVACNWLTIRLKTKKHNIVRISVSSFFIIFNVIAIISISTDLYMKENDYSVYLGLIVSSLLLSALWLIRLSLDINFVLKGVFEDKEVELQKVLREKFNLSTTHSENDLCTKDNLEHGDFLSGNKK